MSLRACSARTSSCSNVVSRSRHASHNRQQPYGTADKAESGRLPHIVEECRGGDGSLKEEQGRTTGQLRGVAGTTRDAVTDVLFSQMRGIASTVSTPTEARAADRPTILSGPLALLFLSHPAPFPLAHTSATTSASLVVTRVSQTYLT